MEVTGGVRGVLGAGRDLGTLGQKRYRGHQGVSGVYRGIHRDSQYSGARRGIRASEGIGELLGTVGV